MFTIQGWINGDLVTSEDYPAEKEKNAQAYYSLLATGYHASNYNFPWKVVFMKDGETVDFKQGDN